MRAAAILEELFDRNPEHPGVVHYLIHSYDDPTHAPLGLRAARVYARVAPAAHHALHMPSHIFVQLGQWEDVAASNEDAWAASVDWVKRRGHSIDKQDFHSLSWLLYAYLQQGRYGKARETLEIARRAARESDSPRVAGSLDSMEARYLSETRSWSEARLPAGTEGEHASGSHCGMKHQEHGGMVFAAGMAAAKKGDAAVVEQAIARLRSLPKGGRGYGAQAVEIMEKEISGMALLAQGKAEEGLALLAEAAAMEEAMTPPSGPPDLLKPAHELYGEALLERGRAEEAAEHFGKSLLRMPNRTASLLGAARAAVKLGRTEDARRHYAALAEIWRQADAGMPELAEVQGYLSGTDNHRQTRTNKGAG
jgi:tetratricopeptide (TPR) repeat protein